MSKSFILSCFFINVAFAQVQVHHNEAQKKVEVSINNLPFTAYFYPNADVLKKPVLFPILTSEGTAITRGWPLEPRESERIDHPHHVGHWFNYGDVNGHDFWNNSIAIDKSHKGPFGTIVHTGIKKMKSGKKGILVVTANWLDKDQQAMLQEETTFIFEGKGKQRSITRKTTLKALQDVSFKDNKEGMFALRVARQLEHPSNKAEVFTDASGQATAVPKMDNTGVTGKYENSEGQTGDDVWGKRAKFMNLTGKIGEENISVAILDHPKNFNYPAYWHARGYGLYAVNSIGQNVFDSKQPELLLNLKAGEHTTFKFKILITSGEISLENLNKEAVKF